MTMANIAIVIFDFTVSCKCQKEQGGHTIEEDTPTQKEERYDKSYT